MQEPLSDQIFKLLAAAYRVATHPDVSALFTIAGTIISAYVLWSVSDIKRRLMFNARLPQILQGLQQNASMISTSLQTFEESGLAIETELAKCVANLHSLEDKVKKPERALLVTLISAVERFQTDEAHHTKLELRRLYTSLNGLIQTLSNMAEDYRLEQ